MISYNQMVISQNLYCQLIFSDNINPLVYIILLQVDL